MGNEAFKPVINESLDKPDNIEVLRGHIAAIIKGETQYQYKMAKDIEEKDAEDYNHRVFIENARPYDPEGEPQITPFVNVMLHQTTPAGGNSRIGAQKMKATFIIDCVAFGNDGGEEWNEKVANFRAWKAARVIRKIIMSEQYAYLGLKGKVGSRNITSMETRVPESGGDAFTFVIVRITLEAEYLESFVGDPGVPLEGIDYTVIPTNGEVLIEID